MRKSIILIVALIIWYAASSSARPGL